MSQTSEKTRFGISISQQRADEIERIADQLDIPKSTVVDVMIATYFNTYPPHATTYGQQSAVEAIADDLNR